ncbi:MAG: hypothetical protein AAGA96_01670 [Verrucomicrobiota bacterium]
MKYFLVAALASSSMTLGGMAQFHSKTQEGHVAVNQHAIDSAQAHYDAMMKSQASGTNNSTSVGHNPLSSIIVSDAQRELYGASMSQQKDMLITVWGRAIHHPDGRFTESKQDESTNTLEQLTKSKNGTLLQRRMVNLDQKTGRPEEVLIYDGRGTFKYRGIQVYDRFGRFSEEQLYDAKGTLIRRKVQEYAPDGSRMPLRSWDYVANVPKDLQLIITRESEAVGAGPDDDPQPSAHRTDSQPQGDHRMTGHAGGVAQGQSPQSEPASKKGINLGRMFSRKN